jgi:hypothetical protein
MYLVLREISREGVDITTGRVGSEHEAAEQRFNSAQQSAIAAADSYIAAAERREFSIPEDELAPLRAERARQRGSLQERAEKATKIGA